MTYGPLRAHRANKPIYYVVTKIVELKGREEGNDPQPSRMDVWMGWVVRVICKSVIKSGRLIVKSPNPPYRLNVDPMAHIEVCMVYTKKLVP